MTIELAHTPLPSLRTHHRSSRRHARLRVAVAAAVVGFAALVVLFYVASYHAFIPNSDGATVVLEGQSMSTGNLLLHHWALSLDSFWTVDAPFYMVAVLMAGVRPLLLHLVPAVIAALVVVTGSLLARQGRRGLPGIAAVATVVALLGLPSHVLSVFFLQGPLHVGTVLWCLLAFAGLRRGRLGWGWVAAVVLFAASALGDFQMVALGMIPALIGGVLAMARARHWRRGITTAMAPVVGFVLAALVRVVANALGTFTVARPNPIAPPSQILPNVGRVATWGAHLLGLGGGVFGSGGLPAPLAAVHALGIVAVVGGVSWAAIGLVRGVRPGHPLPIDPTERWRLDDLLVLAFLADLVVFVVFTTGNDANYSRYLTAGVVFGSILAGRALGQMLETVRIIVDPAGHLASWVSGCWLRSPPGSLSTSRLRCQMPPTQHSASSSNLIIWTVASVTTGAPRSPRWQRADRSRYGPWSLIPATASCAMSASRAPLGMRGSHFSSLSTTPPCPGGASRRLPRRQHSARFSTPMRSVRTASSCGVIGCRSRPMPAFDCVMLLPSAQ